MIMMDSFLEKYGEKIASCAILAIVMYLVIAQ